MLQPCNGAQRESSGPQAMCRQWGAAARIGGTLGGILKNEISETIVYQCFPAFIRKPPSRQ